MAEPQERRYAPPLPQQALAEIAENLYWLPGTIGLGPLMRISRNMLVLRHGDELTVVNAVRPGARNQATLESLGKVRHVVRIGAFHGLDDAWYKDHYGAEFWCQPNSDRYPEPRPDHLLIEGAELPLPGLALFLFRLPTRPEAALLFRVGPGWLITCDSLQHYGDFSRHSLLARLLMRRMGFRRGLQIGPIWLKMLTPSGGTLQPDFERLAQWDFDALVSAHGTPLVQGAAAALAVAIGDARWSPQ
ncbi:MAG: hypothetical protein D6727_01515 [Gammaproteobacteria bacterium]|nr:MAG: hypothetical protein D6727_01515 [Gammaproteobacteria bacterium]